MKLEIAGAGIITTAGMSANEILQNHQIDQANHGIQNITLNSIDGNALRRTTQYSKVLIKSAELALEQSGIDLNQVNKERFGTIINTVYGPIETNLKFAKSVLKGDPDLASPMVFSNTVTNASLGHLCITFGFKGDSTFLMGSNPIKYSDFLFNKKTIDHILVAGIEEYSEGLAMEYQNFYSDNLKHAPAECGAALVLRNETNEDALGYIYKSYGMSLLSNPYWETANENEFMENLNLLYKEVTNDFEDIDLVVLGAVGTPLEEAEKEFYSHLEFQSIREFKSCIGEVFGASLVAFIVLALQIFNENRDIRKIAVNHLDVSMNYFTVIIGRE
ncbi:hypothetical protein [Paenibacillus crassostreae]|uniref:Beta-ketoacyl synthase N-terminal domain-containing protein n=1 Tax=Paenibacillus crassostreae TaxID=1763538 RepID=A0A167FB17_9BACL|nr:hypothetical protein [Paenibacillus crassostreae]AOZ90864.1 hypothetical protein LPB68_00685 [Paenibacillus crassostreae]OAB76369.1 hypothetical protein PNBC_02850 [Paenibacillus crassostreae]